MADQRAKAKSSGTKKSKMSSGKSKSRRIRFLIRRSEMKMNRWKRYQEEIVANQRSGNLKRWDTAGLEKYIQTLSSHL